MTNEGGTNYTNKIFEGVLVITDRVGLYKEILSKARGCYGYQTEFATTALEAEKLAGEDDKGWIFCYIDGVRDLDQEEIRRILGKVPIYVRGKDKLVLYNGSSEPQDSLELNGNDESDLIKRVVDDREGRVQLNGELGWLGKYLERLRKGVY